MIIDMASIPAGEFLMGSPEGVGYTDTDEKPQHRVRVPAFFMGKYPVTQAQWRAVAALPKINRDLDPDPARFKGDNRPVEQVSWYDAVEFCKRLSQHTGKTYRLPSEAEWEYACRAGTTTPFHFGPTITTDLANYNGNYTYGDGPEGISREKTTAVGNFPPNAFGLHDMHGNVWEWCQDDWHENYNEDPEDGKSPEDGRAWLSSDDRKMNRKVLRGGSWGNYPRNCRAACRDWYPPDKNDDNIGFRVVGEAI